MLPKRPHCKGCRYYRHISSSPGNNGCHYMHDTGELRGCTAEECGKNKVHYCKGANKPKSLGFRFDGSRLNKKSEVAI